MENPWRIKLAPLTEEQLKSFESRKSKVESRTPKSLDLDALFNTEDVPAATEVTQPKGKTSEAQKKANKKWQDKQSRMTFRMSPELRTQVDSHAQKRGESTTAFITRAIKEQIKRDNEQ